MLELDAAHQLIPALMSLWFLQLDVFSSGPRMPRCSGHDALFSRVQGPWANESSLDLSLRGFLRGSSRNEDPWILQHYLPAACRETIKPCIKAECVHMTEGSWMRHGLSCSPQFSCCQPTPNLRLQRKSVRHIAWSHRAPFLDNGIEACD